MNTTTTNDFPTEYLILALILVIVALSLFSGLANTLQERLEQAALPDTIVRAREDK